MLPSYSSVEKRRESGKQAASHGNRKFYVSIIASLALLSLVGFFAYSESYEPLTTTPKAEAQAENVALFVEANKKGEKEPPFEEGLLDEDVGETAPVDEEAWEEFAAKAHEWEEDKEAAPEFEVNGAETAPVDEEAVRRFEMGKHEWEVEENVEWTEDFKTAPEVDMDIVEDTAPLDEEALQEFDMEKDEYLEENNQYAPMEEVASVVTITEHAPAMLAVPEGYACESKSGSFRLSRGQKLFDIYIGDSYNVEFYVKMDSTSGSGSLIWVGDSESDEQPEVFYWSSSSSLDVEWEAEKWTQWNYAAAGIVRGGPEKLVRVEVRGTRFELFVDNQSKGYKFMPLTTKGAARKRGVWAYPLWKSFSYLQGTVRDVRVCGQTVPPAKPASLPALYSGCIRKSGSVTIGKGNKLFEATTGKNYDLAFYVTLQSNSGGGPILWVGNSETDEQPELFYFTDGDLDVEWDNGKFYQFHFSDAEIWRGLEFMIQVKVRGYEYELLVNGLSKGRRTFPPSVKGTTGITRGFWSYPSWKDYPYLRGSVRDVTFYPVADTTTTTTTTAAPTLPNGYVSCLTRLGAPFAISKATGPLFYHYKQGYSYDISFYVTIEEKSIEIQSPLLWIGNDMYKQQPRIMYNGDGTLKVNFRHTANTGMVFGGPILPGREHFIKLESRVEKYTLYVDGVNKGTATKARDSYDWWRYFTVYTVPPFSFSSSLFRAQMRDLKICTIDAS